MMRFSILSPSREGLKAREIRPWLQAKLADRIKHMMRKGK
jgi:hypothetical protein